MCPPSYGRMFIRSVITGMKSKENICLFLQWSYIWPQLAWTALCPASCQVLLRQKEEGGGNEMVTEPTPNQLKALSLEIDYCFVSAKPWEASRDSLDLPLQWVIFQRHFWASGNKSRVEEIRHSGIFKEDAAANSAGGFVSLWRQAGFQRWLAKTQPSWLVHVTAWCICQRWYNVLFGLITAAVCPPSTTVSYLEVWPRSVCVCVYTLPMLGSSVICHCSFPYQYCWYSIISLATKWELWFPSVRLSE